MRVKKSIVPGKKIFLFCVMLSLFQFGCAMDKAPVCPVPGESKCSQDGINKRNVYSVCSESNVWEEISNGCYQCSEDGKTCEDFVCVTGDKVCQSNDDGMDLYIECQNEHWSKPMFCSKCADDKDCETSPMMIEGACTESECYNITKGEKQYSVLAACQNNSKKVVYCASNEVCFEGMCQPGCTGNDFVCEEDIEDGQTRIGHVYKCDNGIRHKIKDCNGVCNDSKDDCEEGCINGTTRCFDEDGIGKLKTCEGARWSDSVSCKDNASCSDTTSCGECLNASIECIDGQILHCSSGRWGDAQLCPGGVSCITASICGECINGDTRCTNDENQIGRIRKCENGEWGSTEQCADGASCSSASDCGKCMNGDTQCEEQNEDSGALRTCVDGSWGEAKPCTTWINTSESVSSGCKSDSQCKEVRCDESGYAYVQDVYFDRIVKAYCIGDLSKLIEMRDAINQGEVYPEGNEEQIYVLSDDITIANGETWEPIGNEDHPFSGKFFGDNRIIQLNNVVVNGAYKDMGLFGVIIW